MFSAITFEPADGGATLTLLTDAYPVATCSWRYETASEEQPVQDHSGQHESPAPVRRMTITLAGLMVAADGGADYWAKRAPVAAALVPAQGTIGQGTINDYRTGRLNIILQGGTPVYYADVVLASLDFPVEPGIEASDTSPRSSGYAASMRCNYGYWKHNGTAVRI